MGKVFGWVAMLVALYLAMTLYTKGIEHAFDGAFAPIQPGDHREEPSATSLSPAAQLADAPSEPRRRVRLTEAVRERVTSDLEEGARRRGY